VGLLSQQGITPRPSSDSPHSWKGREGGEETDHSWKGRQGGEETDDDDGEEEGEGAGGEGVGRLSACLTPSPARHVGYVVDDLVAAERELAAELRVSSIASPSSRRCDELEAEFVALQVDARTLHPSAPLCIACTPPLHAVHTMHALRTHLHAPCILDPTSYTLHPTPTQLKQRRVLEARWQLGAAQTELLDLSLQQVYSG